MNCVYYFKDEDTLIQLTLFILLGLCYRNILFQKIGHFCNTGPIIGLHVYLCVIMLISL